jgi:hypothetical protein
VTILPGQMARSSSLPARLKAALQIIWRPAFATTISRYRSRRSYLLSGKLV